MKTLPNPVSLVLERGNSRGSTQKSRLIYIFFVGFVTRKKEKTFPKIITSAPGHIFYFTNTKEQNLTRDFSQRLMASYIFRIHKK